MIDVILIEAETDGNIGAIARVMKNFSFKNLVLVSPKTDHLSEDAKRRGKHAQDILKKAKVIKFEDLKKYDYLVGTTSKLGNDYNLPRCTLDPVELGKKLSTIKKRKIGIVFGRESIGLTNEEITHMDFLVAIPTNPKYSALNISHSVGILLYELSKYLGKSKIGEMITPISAKEKDVIMNMVKKNLDTFEFNTKEKKETQITIWKKVLGKAMLTKREAFAIMGFFRKIKK